MPVVTTAGKLVLGLVRGDDRLSEPKMVGVLESDYRPATDEEIRATFGAGGGSLGPVGVDVEIIADEALREGHFVAGANRDGWHLLGVEAGRDYTPRFADIREAREGDRCPVCGGTLRFQTAIEVGHIFKFGSRYSSRSARRSSTRTGPRSRSSEAATASVRRASWQPLSSRATTRTGSSGPRRSRRTTSTFSRSTGAPSRSSRERRKSRRRWQKAASTSCSTTATSAREKFADADLVGCPVRVIAGKKTLDDGAVDVRRRDGSAEDRVAVADVLKWVQHA